MNDEIPKFTKVQEAQTYITDLKKAMHSMHYENRQLKIHNTAFTNQIDKLQAAKVIINLITYWFVHVDWFEWSAISVAKHVLILSINMFENG